MGNVSVGKFIAWAHGLRTRHIERFSRGDLFFGWIGKDFEDISNSMSSPTKKVALPTSATTWR
jgi:hypothetical protein